MTTIIAIDGPAGSGKSSVSREASRRLGYGYLDTGAAYRALTWWALDLEIDPHNENEVAALLATFPYSISLDPSEERIVVGEVSVVDVIREPRISLSVSAIAQNMRVREWMKNSARNMARDSVFPGIVAEGRDLTTIVFPDAPTRILLTAREEVRISRRAKDVVGSDLAETITSVRERDAQDSTVVDFLNAAPGVVVIDSSDLDFEGTVGAVVECVTRGTAHE